MVIFQYSSLHMLCIQSSSALQQLNLKPSEFRAFLAYLYKGRRKDSPFPKSKFAIFILGITTLSFENTILFPLLFFDKNLLLTLTKQTSPRLLYEAVMTEACKYLTARLDPQTRNYLAFNFRFLVSLQTKHFSWML